jgi:hypothetical protein
VVIFVNYVKKDLTLCCLLKISFVLEFKTVQLSFNLTYTPNYQNASSNASQQLRLLINQTLSTPSLNITNGGVRANISSIM